jgi:hypothetical protein
VRSLTASPIAVRAMGAAARLVPGAIGQLAVVAGDVDVRG